MEEGREKVADGVHILTSIWTGDRLAWLRLATELVSPGKKNLNWASYTPTSDTSVM